MMVTARLCCRCCFAFSSFASSSPFKHPYWSLQRIPPSRSLLPCLLAPNSLPARRPRWPPRLPALAAAAQGSWAAAAHPHRPAEQIKEFGSRLTRLGGIGGEFWGLIGSRGAPLQLLCCWKGVTRHKSARPQHGLSSPRKVSKKTDSTRPGPVSSSNANLLQLLTVLSSGLAIP